MTATYHEGYQAFLTGQTPANNPHPAGSPQAQDWLAGWDQARADRQAIARQWSSK